MLLIIIELYIKSNLHSEDERMFARYSSLDYTCTDFEYRKGFMASFLPATTESLIQATEAKAAPEAIAILYRVLDDPSSTSEALRIKEQAVSSLSDLLR